ncbi:MAG: hypothetical protein AAF773_00210 [Cyanobacteria bacterium P01_D01_bin.115]
MSVADLLIEFPSMFAALLWNLSEASGVPLGQEAPSIFGLMIGSAAVPIDE